MKILFLDWHIMKPSAHQCTWFTYERTLTTGPNPLFTMTGVVLITSVECSGDHVPVTPVAAYGAWLQLQLVSTTYPRFTRAWALCIYLPAASDMLVPIHLPILKKLYGGWLVAHTWCPQTRGWLDQNRFWHDNWGVSLVCSYSSANSVKLPVPTGFSNQL